jgi:putative ABC transport system permease protein
MPDFKTLVQSAFADRGCTPDADVVEEFTQHAAAAWESARADGVAEHVATDRVRALVAAWCADPRAGRGRPRRAPAIEPPPATGRVFAGFTQDVRYAARLLRRQPGYAAVAILTMALGIGATTTLFSVAYGVLLKPLPWPDADRIVRVTETRRGQAARINGTVTNGSYLAWRDHPSTIETIGGYTSGGYTLGTASATVMRPGADEPLRLPIARLTPSMFDVLKARPILGRAFVDDDAPAGGQESYWTARAIVISHALWREWFGERADVIGTTLRVDDQPVTIVGVMPHDFAFPDPIARAWLPMPVAGVLAPQGVRRIVIFSALARLKPGVTPAQAAVEATARARTAPDPGLAAVAMFGSSAPPEIVMTPAVEAMTADVKPAIVLLMAAVVLLLATATANIGGLQLARATTRRRELALRAAIGAGSARLTRQLIVESGAVGIAGGLAGLALTLAVHRALPSLLPADFPRAADIAVNLPVLLFTIALSVVTSVACGLLPAASAARIDLACALADDGSTWSSAGWRTPAGRLRPLIMVGQVAVACVLLLGAALLSRSLMSLIRADRGYDPTNVLTARINLPSSYDGPRRAAFADAVVARLNAAPGVLHAAAGNALPLFTIGGNFGFTLPSLRDPAIKVQVQTMMRDVSPEYFQTLGLRMLRGRTLSDSDGALSRPVVVVNRTFAQRYLGDKPIGARLPIGFGEGRPDCDVVGVVHDMRQRDVTDAPAAEIFRSYRQSPARLINNPLIALARSSGDPLSLVDLVRATAREQDRAVAVDSIMTMEERVMASLAKPRLYTTLLTAFAAGALLIACVGLFGVLSYLVAQRAREIGVRTALGAQTRDIIALVLKHAAAVAAAGVAIGLTVSLALARYLSTFLYGVTTHDTASFVAVAIVMAVVAAIASVVPARRAARVDPLIVLKST